MKIGITCYPTYGGSGALATELGLELARRGHEVHFITYASPFRLRRLCRAGLLPRSRDPMGRYPLFEHFPITLALASKQHEVALRENLDLLHVHYAIPHATTAWIAREMLQGEHRELKVITTLHGTDITLVGPGVELLRHHQVLDRAVGRWSPRSRRTCATRRTVPSAACSCDLKVIPNFVNLAEYHPDPNAQAGRPGARRARRSSATSPTSAR